MIRYRAVLATGAIVALLAATAPAGAAQAAPARPGGRILYLHLIHSHDAGELESVRPDGTAQTSHGRELVYYSEPDFSPDGREIAYVDGFSVRVMAAADSTVDRQLGDWPCAPSGPSWSPDGRWVAFETCGDIFRVDRAGYQAGYLNVTDSGLSDLNAAWSPSGRVIATATRPGVHLYRAAGSAPRMLSDLPGARRLDWNPDGRTLAVEALGDLWLVDARTGRARQLTRTPGLVESSPVWSPDGRWLAYATGPAAPVPPNPEDPSVPGEPGSGGSVNPQIWLMTAGGTARHSTGVAGVPTSWRADA